MCKPSFSVFLLITSDFKIVNLLEYRIKSYRRTKIPKPFPVSNCDPVMQSISLFLNALPIFFTQSDGGRQSLSVKIKD